MHFDPLLCEGRLIKRYKRFFADIKLHNGEIVTAHCPNTGSMLGLIEEGRRVGISYSSDPKRKLAYTLEMIEENDVMVGVNTHNPNKLVYEGLQSGFFNDFIVYTSIHKEVKINAASRLDFALTGTDLPTCYLEVKNVHYKKENVAYFPDSVTTRGQKHLKELVELKEAGNRCVMIYVIQRNDIDSFAFADFIDPIYARLGERAKMLGVEFLAVSCKVNLEGISLARIL